MTNELIGKFIEANKRKDAEVNIHFRGKGIVKGIFIRNNDYADLKAKNFWRVVSGKQAEEWKQTQNVQLSRIYSGQSISRLTQDELK